MDVARLGLSADTKPIKEAAKDLRDVAAAAKSAGSAVDGASGALNRAATGASAAGTRFSNAASGLTQMNKSSLLSSTAMGTVGTAAASATTKIDLLSGAAVRQVSKFEILREKWLNFLGTLRATPGAANEAGSSLDRLGKHATDNINRMQATPGNIAAQFQDIGVTAAAGMNPMIIALQQGTQLSAAMSGGIGNLGAAFKQLFGPTQLLTIGLVALIAAGIEMVNWPQLAADSLNTLADAIVQISPYLVTLAAGFTLLYAPQIIAGIGTLTTAMYALATGILATIGLPALLVIGFVAMIAALNTWRDEVTKVMGVDIIGAAKNGANFIIGVFVGAFNSIKYTWRMLPSAIGDVVIQAANATISAIEAMVNGAISRINKLTSMLPFGLGNGLQMGNVSMGRIDNQWAGAAKNVRDVVSAQMQAAQQTDYIGKGIELIKNGAKSAADYMRKWAKELLAADDAAKKTGKSSGAASSGKSQGDLWGELLTGADKQMRGLTDAGAQIGVYGQALDQLKYEQQLFNEAQDKGIVLTAAMAAELKNRAAAMAGQAQGNRTAQFNEDTTKSFEEQYQALQVATGAIGLHGAALISYQYQQERVTAATKAGVIITDEMRADWKQYGDEIGRVTQYNDDLTQSLKRQQQSLTFLKDTIKGVFTEWVSNVRNGQNVFSAFADAVVNALNRIIDKALDAALNAALNAVFGGSSGGIMGSILGGGSRTASLQGAASASVSANPSIFAKGGTFGAANDNVTAFAKGGSFTNSIVDSPTLFKFAKGTGLMGEAGPEAVMPLKRGKDGSLGVQVQGGSGGSAPPVNISQTFNIGGVTTPAEINAAIRQSAEQTKQDLKRSVPGIMLDYQRNGTTG